MRSGRPWLLAVLLAVAVVAFWLSRAGEDARPSSARRALESLPYLSWVPAAESTGKSGVVRHDAQRSQPGVNLYAPRTEPQAHLMDMEGRVLQRWSHEAEKGDTWQHVELLPDGGLLAIVSEARLLALDRDSEVVWRLEEPVHHDVALEPTGDLYVLVQNMRTAERSGRELPVLSDSILRLSPEGAVVDRLDLFDLFVDRLSEESWKALEIWLEEWAGPMAELGSRIALKSGSPADLFHANSVEILPRDVGGLGLEGQLLVSLRDIDTIAVIDFEQGSVAWEWGPGQIRRQHHPSLLDNDHLLVFDNRGGLEGYSRVVELDPVTGAIVWSWDGEPPSSFFTELRGGSQRLANGNTLVTESDSGRALEITPKGEVVWEFFNPITRSEGRERSAIYRLTRLDPTTINWLE